MPSMRAMMYAKKMKQRYGNTNEKNEYTLPEGTYYSAKMQEPEVAKDESVGVPVTELAGQEYIKGKRARLQKVGSGESLVSPEMERKLQKNYLPDEDEE